MAHARGGQVDILGGQLVLQVGKLALGLDRDQVLSLEEGHAGRVIAAIFQTLESFDDDRDGRPVSAIPDDAAHSVSLCRLNGTRAICGSRGPIPLAAVWPKGVPGRVVVILSPPGRVFQHARRAWIRPGIQVFGVSKNVPVVLCGSL